MAKILGCQKVRQWIVIGMSLLVSVFSQIQLSAQELPASPNPREVGPVEPEFRVREIRFVDDKGNSVDASSTKIETQVHGVFKSEVVGSDLEVVRRAYPQFSKIDAKVEPIANTSEVVLTFEFQKGRRVQMVRTLDRYGTPMDLKKAPKMKSLQHGPLSSELVSQDVEALQIYFIQQGYPDAQIEPTVKEIGANGEVEIILTIDLRAAHPVKLKQVQILPPNQEIQNIWKAVVKNPNRALHLKDQARTLDFMKLEEDLKKITKAFQESGFVQIKMKKSFQTGPTGETVVSLELEPGRQFQLLSLAISGNQLIPSSQLENFREPIVGRPFSPSRVQKAMDQIRDQYGKLGHVEAAVNADFDGEKGILTLEISEGVKQWVESVRVEGNSKMTADRILLDVPFKKGDLVTSDKIRAAIERLQKTGFYNSVNVSYDAEAEDRGTIVVTVKELSSQSITLLGGMSDLGAHGNVGYSNNNIFGKGKSISADAFFAGEMSVLGLVYRDPHINGSQFGMTLRTGLNASHMAYFDRRERQVKIEIDRQINQRLKVGLGARFESVQALNFAGDLENEIKDQATKGRISGFVGRMSYVDEVRDEHGTTVSGYRWKALLEPSYGMGRYFTKATGELQKHVGLNEIRKGQKAAVTFRLTLGYASSGTPFMERFYAGGDQNLRGMNLWSITPAGSRLGGRVMMGGGTYYVVPVLDGLKGVTFLEAVSVSNGVRPSSGDVRLVGGAGGRVNLNRYLPFLPAGLSHFELGYAKALRKLTQDRGRPIYVVIGGYDPGYD